MDKVFELMIIGIVIIVIAKQFAGGGAKSGQVKRLQTRIDELEADLGACEQEVITTQERLELVEARLEELDEQLPDLERRPSS